MNKLSTEAKTRAMVFFNKGHKFITPRQEFAFLDASGTDAKGLLIDGDFVSFSSVAKIISVDEFYAENPDMKPMARPEMMNLFQSLPHRKYEGKYGTRGLELMREGLAGYMKKTPWNGEGKRPAQDIFEKMGKVIENLKEKKEQPYFHRETA